MGRVEPKARVWRLSLVACANMASNELLESLIAWLMSVTGWGGIGAAYGNPPSISSANGGRTLLAGLLGCDARYLASPSIAFVDEPLLMDVELFEFES